MPEPRRLTIQDFERFSIDEKNSLYWDDKPVQTGITLNRAQFFWAVLAAVATAVNAFANVWNVFIKGPASAPSFPNPSPPAPLSPNPSIPPPAVKQ